MQVKTQMAKQKKTREELLEKKRAAERQRYLKIKNYPEKYAKQKQMEKEKYIKKKEQGKVKRVSDMSPREKRQVRKRRKENVAAFRKRKAAAKAKAIAERTVGEDPTPTSRETLATQEEDRRKASGKKRSEKLRQLRTRTLKQKEAEIKKLKQKLAKMKKRWQRAKKKATVSDFLRKKYTS